MRKKPKLALFVTGSVAAVKTRPLVGALNKRGFGVSVLLTRAPEQWGWVSVSEIRKTAERPVLTYNSPRKNRREALFSSDVILIAPATADFISQLAHASSETAQDILEARLRGARIMLAPAMNYKMWEHPATQRNAAILKGAGVTFLGPVKGALACGDLGFGRMMEVDKIAAGVRAAFDGKRLAALAPRAVTQKSPKSRAPKSCKRILVALGGKNVGWKEIEKLAAAVAKARLDADYVIDKTLENRREALTRLTNQTVASDFFQIPELQGMEHIRLPERAEAVFFPFLDRELAMSMMQGRADTLLLSAYLASKTPVFAAKGALLGLPPSFASSLRQDGLGVVDTVLEFLASPKVKHVSR